MVPVVIVGNAAILQFLKSPESDRVKTRLWPTIGEENARLLHKKLASLVANHLGNMKHVDRYLWSTQLGDFAERLALTYEMTHRQQVGESLGERLSFAVKSSFPRHKKVLVIGSDCPFIGEDYMNAAIHALDSQDVVLGPAKDGGYVLIGMNKYHSQFFEHISWGSEHVLSQTLEKTVALNLTYTLLPVLNDIDVASDLALLKHTQLNDFIEELLSLK